MAQKILVIEDSNEVCESVASILKIGGYEVFTANNGKLGIESVREHEPDLIVCDIMMPDLDGYGVLHLLSKDPNTANIPFIYLTAKTDQRDFRTGMNLGADDFITKPFDGFELLRIIELRLKKNDQLKTSFQHTISDADDFFDKVRLLPEFQKLAENRHSRHYKKKEFVYHEGQPPSFIYLIDKGQVKTFKSNADGKELVTGLHGPGEFIGFVPSLENKPTHESALVTKEADIFLIPREDFLTMIYTNKEIAKKFISVLSSHLYEAENTMFELAYESVRQRVATILIKLHNRTSDPSTLITVSRKDLAKMVGTSTESLNRTLSDFKNEGLLEILNKGIKIQELPNLEKARK